MLISWRTRLKSMPGMVVSYLAEEVSACRLGQDRSVPFLNGERERSSHNVNQFAANPPRYGGFGQRAQSLGSIPINQGPGQIQDGLVGGGAQHMMSQLKGDLLLR